MMKSWKTWGLGAVGVVLGAAVFIILANFFTPHMYAGTQLDTPLPAQNFSLEGPSGQLVSLSDFKGKVVLIFFGYTSCPDVCPATMQMLAGVLKNLGKSADQVQVLLISVDPERDTPERLAEYLSRFDTRIIGLSGSLDQIKAVADAYGVFFEKQPPAENGQYTVNHTSSVFMIDRRGDLQVLYPFGSRSADIAGDVRYLLRN